MLKPANPNFVNSYFAYRQWHWKSAICFKQMSTILFILFFKLFLACFSRTQVGCNERFHSGIVITSWTNNPSGGSIGGSIYRLYYYYSYFVFSYEHCTLIALRVRTEPSKPSNVLEFVFSVQVPSIVLEFNSMFSKRNVLKMPLFWPYIGVRN